MTLVLSFGVTLSLDVILAVVHSIAIGLTAFRVLYRFRKHRLWWDDIVACSAMIGDCAFLAVLWLDYAPMSSGLHSHKSRVSQYWAGLILFLLVVWMTRISLALAIARLFPSREPTRRFAIGLAMLSMIFCTAIVIQAAVVCSREPALNTGTEAVCQWPDSFRAVIVFGNIFTDTILVATPLYKLWRVCLPRKQRRLVLTGFAASASTMTVTVVCGVFLFAPVRLEPGKTILRGKLSYFETGVSLIVCNLIVVMTFLHTVWHRGEDLEMTDETTDSCETQTGTIPHSTLTLTDISDFGSYTDPGCTYESSPTPMTSEIATFRSQSP
ncbi:hypothetical protein CPC08DRAFT_704299 [Agrocybe pediades]|nr:hypothetical protein CPC08DRAFT_704299 [Agrocybe pediades]